MSIIQVLKKNKLLTAVSLIYISLLTGMPEKGLMSIQNSLYYVVEMLQILPVVFILTALIEAWVPRELIMRNFGEKSGVKGYAFSFLLGSFSAGPIYAAFPVCKMLLGKGASVQNIVIILSSWAVIKVPMLANEAKFLGPGFMGIRWILTVISIFFIANIVSAIVKKQDLMQPGKPNTAESGKLSIKEEYCIGCGICARLCPDCFKMSGGKAMITNNGGNMDKTDYLETAIVKCPANAIEYIA